MTGVWLSFPATEALTAAAGAALLFAFRKKLFPAEGGAISSAESDAER